MEATNLKSALSATREQNLVTPISEYTRLLIYSYLNLKEIIFKIEILSQRERKLILNSAIIRENQ
jgi:hypothetical protein